MVTCAARRRPERSTALDVHSARMPCLVAGRDRVDLPVALDNLAARGLRHVLCEGGPTLFATALAAGVVDELALSLVPTVVGGDGTRITHGGLLGAPDGIPLTPRAARGGGGRADRPLAGPPPLTPAATQELGCRAALVARPPQLLRACCSVGGEVADEALPALGVGVPLLAVPGEVPLLEGDQVGPRPRQLA